MPRRNLPTRLVLAALISLAVGYGSRALAQGDGAQPPVELVVWGLGEGESQIGRIAAMDEFERRWNADTRRVAQFGPVRLVQSVQGGRMNPQKLMTAIAGGAPPDVINQDRFSIGGWAARDAFLSLDDFLNAQSPDDPLAIREQDYFAACWQEAVYNGRVYAIPNSTDDRLLFYNKGLLKAAGYVDEHGETRPPKNWDELKEYAVRLTSRDELGNMERVGFIPNYGNSWLYLYGWQNGGEFMSPDGSRATLAETRIADALDWITDVYDALGGRPAVESVVSTFQPGALDPFLTGRLAMKINTNGELGNIARYMPDLNFGVAPAPMPPGREDSPITWSGGFSWAIPRGAAHPEVAWEFIRWMVSEEATLLMNRVRDRYNRARGRLYVPDMSANRRINDVVYAQFVERSPYLPPAFKQYSRLAADMMPASRFRPVTPVGQLLWDEHARAFERATRHEYSSQEALQLGTREVQRELDRLHRDTGGVPMRWGLPVAAILAALIVAGAFLVARAYRRRAGAWHRRGVLEGLAGLAFVSPWLVGFAVFTAGPVVASILISFTEYDVLHRAEFVAWRNYWELLAADPVFWKALGNTAFMVLGVPIGMAVGLGIALLLNADVRGMAAYRTVFYLPAIVPVVASSVLWIWVLNPDGGLLNSGLRFLRVEGILTWLARAAGAGGLYWLQEQVLAKPAIILMGLWSAGSSMIIWLAGLKGIPSHLYEAAAIDGANRWERFVHVTLPMLSPYIFFNLIMGIIGTFQIFTQAYVMTQGGPADATLFYVYYLFNSAFQYFRMGYASAMAWILFAIVLALTLIQLRLAPRWVHYEADDTP